MRPSTMPPHIVTRFAPSPTGRLHIGHGWSALMAYDLAQAAGGTFRLRIEDIDGVRSREEHVAGIIEDLTWLGLSWDGDVVRQSARLGYYASALDRLKAMELVYPCFCTRADIVASASAPHGPEGAIYPGTCRHRVPDERLTTAPHAWRIDIAKAVALTGPLTWEDADHGPILADPLAAGDVVLARKDAPTSYHLAATVDDAAMGISLVLRGCDLLLATDIHRLLQALLDLPTPLYRHHGLLVDADGKRLAKRSGGIQLAELRAAGVDPAQLRNNLRDDLFPVGISLQHT